MDLRENGKGEVDSVIDNSSKLCFLATLWLFRAPPGCFLSLSFSSFIFRFLSSLPPSSTPQKTCLSHYHCFKPYLPSWKKSSNKLIFTEILIRADWCQLVSYTVQTPRPLLPLDADKRLRGLRRTGEKFL